MAADSRIRSGSLNAPDRMEIPASTWAGREGMKAGYGLSNYWTVQDGFVYHGHNGGVNGGITVLAYMADLDAGYFFSTNTGSGDAVNRVDKALRGYVTRNLQKPPVPPAAALPADAEQHAGWYEPDSPRNEMTHFLDRLAGITRVRFRDGGYAPRRDPASWPALPRRARRSTGNRRSEACTRKVYG